MSMNGGIKLLDQIEMTLRSKANDFIRIYIDVFDNDLSKKWLQALNSSLNRKLHLEKNYCWLGFVEGDRNLEFLCNQVNQSIQHLNNSDIDYNIDDSYDPNNVIDKDLELNHDHLNQLHRYFEDLQGTSNNLSKHYIKADATTRWHIRQLNLLCHEIESLALSIKQSIRAPEWRRPSQLMCWLQAPRFALDTDDYKHFGIETIARDLGGVYLGVNKAVGKHHWEVFLDEGRDSRINELTTTALRSQTEAAGDFDIEWANNPGAYSFMQHRLSEFRHWLRINDFDPDDPELTLGHPKVAQVNLQISFGTADYNQIWHTLSRYMDVYKIKTNETEATYEYRWSDVDYIQRQIEILK